MRFRGLSKLSRNGLALFASVLLAAVVVYGVARFRSSREAPVRLGPIVHTVHSPTLGYPEKPNIVLILIDTLRPDHLGAYGYSRPTSPAIDRLAREDGILFERAYSVAPWTNPAIATLFTGKYPQSVLPPARHRLAIRQALPKNHKSLAEAAKEAGYRTVALVDHPGINQRLGFSRGFDEFHVLFAESDTRHWRRTDLRFVFGAFQAATARTAASEQPLFLYLHLVYPHRPYMPAPRYARRFGSGFTENEESQKEGMINMYDAEIRQTDDLLDKMFADMKAGGWFDDTAIILTSDHGEGFWEHGVAEHGTSFFDEQIRIPLIVVPPGGRTREPAEIAHPVSNVGVFATVLDFAGVLPERGVHGQSLLRLLHPDGLTRWDQVPDWIFSESPHSGDIHAAAALSSDGKKYVRHQKSDLHPEEMLFDLAADPIESDNLADESPRLEAYRLLLQEHTDMNRAALAASDQETVDVDPETLERLRALGYIQ